MLGRNCFVPAQLQHLFNGSNFSAMIKSRPPSGLAVAHIKWLTREFQIFPSINARKFLIVLELCHWASAPGHHLEKKTPEIFGFRNCRENRMITRLLEPEHASRGTPGVYKRVGDCVGECRIAHVVRA